MLFDSKPERVDPEEMRKDAWLDMWLKGRVKGLHEGWTEGWDHGMRLGKAELIEVLLKQRFGTVPDSTLVQLVTADPLQLQKWGAVLLEAPTLESVFTLGAMSLKDFKG